ncbi:MAG: HAD-IB family hydrolase [Bifidobacteriaceae bacterium]|nr:HAD-IB family hydrolase [Bifidobacteriaceae bacterium]
MAQPRAAAFFDLDKTLIATTSTAAFIRDFLDLGLTTRRAILKSAYAQAAYLFGRAGHRQSERLRDAMARGVTGWDPAAVRGAVEERLGRVIDPVLFPEAVALVAEHRAAGRDIVVVSASGREVVEPIAARLGARHAIATRMDVADGRYTDRVEFFCYGPAKAEAMSRLAQAEGYDLAASFAYSDSITDLPMLQAVGHPAVVNPSKTLADAARRAGWPILRFAPPGRGASLPPGAAGLAAALAAAALALALAAAAGAALAARRRAPCPRGGPNRARRPDRGVPRRRPSASLGHGSPLDRARGTRASPWPPSPAGQDLDRARGTRPLTRRRPCPSVRSAN